MQRAQQKHMVLTFQGVKRQFFVSSKTKPHVVNALIRKAFNLDAYGRETPRMISQHTKNKQKISKNLIQLTEQKSFEQQIKLYDLPFEEPYKLELIKMKSLTPSKTGNQTLINQLKVAQSPLKSHLTNEISFQNQFYQPSWFAQGNSFTKIQKAFISALIKNNDTSFISFCNGLKLKNQYKEALNMKLIKVFVNEYIDQQMKWLKQQTKFYLQVNQDNRKSPIFKHILQLSKFGKVDSFINHLASWEETVAKQQRISYLQIAKEIQKKKSTTFGFGLKLMSSENNQQQQALMQSQKLVGKIQLLNDQNSKIATKFHEIAPQIKHLHKNVTLPLEFSAAEKAMISDRIIKNDPFLIQNYIPNKSLLASKKIHILPVKTVRQYIQSNQTRYRILEELNLDTKIRTKLHKLETFRSLLYFLYKQRVINKKQQKIFFYLYIWSDLNILGVFQLYLHDRDLEQFAETIYDIDYNYFHNQKYGLQMSEVENFSLQIELQLVFMMLFCDKIKQLGVKVAIQKFIRAGDCTLLKLVKQNSDNCQFIIKSMTEYGQAKRKQLQQLSKKQIDTGAKLVQLKSQRKTFLEQIIPVQFKKFKKKDIVQQCIDLQQIKITSIFSVYQTTNELSEWIQSFTIYIQQLQTIHCNLLFNKIAGEGSLDLKKIKQTAKPEYLKGIYECYLMTKDEQQAKDSLRHVLINLPK